MQIYCPPLIEYGVEFVHNFEIDEDAKKLVISLTKDIKTKNNISVIL